MNLSFSISLSLLVFFLSIENYNFFFTYMLNSREPFISHKYYYAHNITAKWKLKTIFHKHYKVFYSIFSCCCCVWNVNIIYVLYSNSRLRSIRLNIFLRKYYYFSHRVVISRVLHRVRYTNIHEVKDLSTTRKWLPMVNFMVWYVEKKVVSPRSVRIYTYWSTKDNQLIKK